MVFPDISFIPENYEPILKEIKKLKNVNDNSKELLGNIVRDMKNYDGQIQKLEIRLSITHYRLTNLKIDYK